MISRKVKVTGIESATGIIGFTYESDLGIESLTHTTVTVRFKGGQGYAYRNVPVSLCDEWYHASSHGKFFIEHLKYAYDAEKQA